jgi:hypothetical protein
MNEIEKLNERINMLEGRCEYLGIVLSAFVHAWEDKTALLRVVENFSLSNDAAMLYSNSPIEKPQDSVSRSLALLVEKLRAMTNSPDQN